MNSSDSIHSLNHNDMLHGEMKKNGIEMELNHHVAQTDFRVKHRKNGFGEEEEEEEKEGVVVRTSSKIKSVRRDPSLIRETIRVRVEFKILAPIHIPHSQKIIPKSKSENSQLLRQYIEFILQKTNENLNAYGDEFDNADFLNDNLFSVAKNPSKQAAVRHQLIYEKHLLMLARSNVEIFIEDFDSDVVYDPFYQGLFQKSVFKALKQSAVTNSLDNTRKLIDPVVKGDFPASDPLKKLSIWVVDLPGELNKLQGYGTFPWDSLAGGPFDGIVLNAGNMQWDLQKMDDPSYAGFKTIAHELCHTIGGLPHTFENKNLISDIPDQLSSSRGSNYQLFDWPKTNGQFHCLFDLMDYQEDTEMQGLTHDQVILLRKTLTLNILRKSLCERIPTPADSPWIAPLLFNHYIPDEVLDWDLEDLANDVDERGQTSFKYNPYQRNASQNQNKHTTANSKYFYANGNSRNWSNTFDHRLATKNTEPQHSAFRISSHERRVNDTKVSSQTKPQEKTAKGITQKEKQNTNTNWIQRLIQSFQKVSCSRLR